MDINKDDIKKLRNYLLIHSREIRNSLRNALPGILLKYSTVVEDGFLQNIQIDNIGSSIGASHLIPELNQLKIDYYFSLAELHEKGETNEKISFLIENDNKLFKEIIQFLKNENFEKEISLAFLLNERASLKRQFTQLDVIEDIQPNEITTAFQQIERESLKEKFIYLDQQDEKKVVNYGVVPKASKLYTDFEKPFASKKSIWKPIAIAACTIGIILLITFIKFNSRNYAPFYAPPKSNYTANKSITDSNETNKIQNVFAPFNKPDTEIVVTVKIAPTAVSKYEEKVLVRFYDVDKRIDDMMKAYSNDASKSDITKRARTIEKQIDSLSLMKNMYTFENGILSLYLPASINIELGKSDKMYRLRIATILYLINITEKPKKLQKE